MLSFKTADTFVEHLRTMGVPACISSLIDFITHWSEKLFEQKL